MHLSLLPHWRFLWLMTASLLAGALNAMAGGGSFLAFPAVLGMGISPIQANATNTVALWPGQLTSLATLRGDLRRELLPIILGASVLGGVSGALTLLHTRQRVFLHILPWLLLGATIIFGVSGPLSRRLHARSHRMEVQKPTPLLPLFLALLPVCFYVGYFGAGGGLLFMSVLSLFGLRDMYQLNSLKILAGCCSNLSAVATFIFRGSIAWRYCLVAMLFAGVGGYLGARSARRLKAETLRRLVVCIGALISAYFFWRKT
jgi:uncharacterized membrane protein YfcA